MRELVQKFLGWLVVFLSRCVNVATGGAWELFCTRCYRDGWTRTAAALDLIWFSATGTDRHVRRSYIWETRMKGLRRHAKKRA